MTYPFSLWLGFNIAIAVFLLIDLVVFNRKAHEIKIKEAALWSIFWVSIAIAFGFSLRHFFGNDVFYKYLTAYIVEQSLSVDNLFVFLVIFSYYKVNPKYQHRVLFIGILGTMILRALFIIGGLKLLHQFHWLMYFFGAFLIYTGFKLLFDSEKEVDPEKNPFIAFLRKFLPLTNKFQKEKLFVKERGRYLATPMFIVMLVLVITDVMFAFDSIPAVLAITSDPFIAFTSNMMAVMGLRSMFFVIEGLIKIFHYINYGLAVILSFIGVKLLVADWFHIGVGLTLGVIGTVLAVSIAASLIWPKKHSH
jgi:tellurite resistance protein TerC